MYNSCSFIGNVVADPEIRFSNDNKKIAKFKMGVSKKFKGEKVTQWPNFVCLSDGLSGVIEKYVRKGMKLHVVGEFNQREYEKDGQKVYWTEFIVRDLTMLDSAGQAGGMDGGQSGYDSGSAAGGDFGDDIPFAPFIN